jgi:hypothetical protein
MSRSFLTGINLNKNELLNARIQNLASAPSSPVAGQVYYNTGDNTLRYYSGTAWVTLAQGGDVTSAITAAIDALTTDVIEEGSTNKYFTDERAQDAIATAIAAGTHSNITITYDDSTNKFTFAAENGVADSTTDNLTEGSTNKYFTDERAQDAIGNAVGTGLSYNDTTGAISVDTNTIASKTYVDGLVQGLSVKDSVRAATAVAGTLATSFEDGDTVGGVVVATGDRILIKNQADGLENGIYVVAASGAPARAADADPTASELDEGSYVLVTEGTYAATGWLVTDSGSGGIVWTQFSAANEYTAGTNIAIAGNAISFSGTLPIANGGTGATTAAGAKTELGFTTKYAASNPELTPSSGVVTWTVTHSLGTSDVTVEVFEKTTSATVEVDVVRTNTNVVTLSWVAAATVTAADYRVVVIG